MEQLIHQVQLLTQKVTEQDAIINTANLTRFRLTASQVIKNFNDIKPFSGEDNYKLKSFFKAIENAEELCGENNVDLKEYCLKLVVNAKIIGKARNAILEIPERLRNWTTVKATLTTRFRPKFTIHQLLFQAKEVKVFNLKDLFNKLTTFKSDISEICDYENDPEFTYKSIDKELVLILKTKCIPLLQIQIDEDLTLFELDNQFCKSEIYLSGEIIKPIYKLNSIKYEGNKSVSKPFKFEGNKEKAKDKTDEKTNFFKKPWQDFKQNKPNFSGQFKQNFNKQNGSGQFKNKAESMEIDNLVKAEDEEVEEIETKGIEDEGINEEVNFQ